MKKLITTKTIVEADGQVSSSQSTAKEIPLTQHSGFFMIMTADAIDLLKPLLNGDAGRVLQILMLSIELDGLIHLNQKQICEKMGLKEKSGKSIVSRGIKRLVEIGILRKTEYKNQQCFVFHPSINRGKKNAELRWKEAAMYSEIEKQKALEKAREILSRIKNSVTENENVDSEIESAIQSFDLEIQDEISWDNAQEWDGESL